MWKGTESLVGKLRVRGVGLDSIETSHRAQAVLCAFDLRLGSLSPSALLIIRRFNDPLPRNLPLHRSSEHRITNKWKRAVERELDFLARTAARPLNEFISADANAVLFSDRSELLACLARDWCAGSVTAQWWWREILGKGEVARRVWEAWLAAPEFVPAAFEHLERMGDAVRFAAALPESAAAMLTEKVALVHGVAAVFTVLRVSYKEHPSPDGSKASTPQAEDSPTNSEALIPGPASSKPLRFVPESSLESLGVRQRILLDLALGLRRAPLWVRSQDYADGIAGLLQGEFAHHEQPARSYSEDAALDVGGEQSDSLPLFPEEARETVAPLPGNLNYQPDQKPPVQASISKTTDSLIPRFMVEGGQGAQPALTPALLPEGKGLFSLLPLGEGPGMRVAETPNSPSVTSLVSTASHSLPMEEEDMGGLLAELPLETRSLAQDEPVVSAPLPLEERGGTEELPKAASLFPETGTVSTRFGGCFYLVNLGLFLELYGDFTRPLHAGISLSIWDFVALVGERLAGKSLRRDPLWALLARLAVRGGQDEPGAGFDAPAEWRMPLAWLKPFPTGMNWLATADDLRLRVFHPLGFTVIDVPLDSGDPTEQLSRELAPYVGLFAGPLQFSPTANTLSREAGRALQPSSGGIMQDSLSPSRHKRFRAGRHIPAGVKVESEIQVGAGHARDELGLTVKKALDQNQSRPWAAPTWLDWLMPYVLVRLAFGLGITNPEKAGRLLCRQPAKVTVTAAHLDIHFALAKHPIAIRLSGLDRDPGWVPAAGRSLHFHFD